jgi:uncharacterized protein YdaU (DUF1376 family)
MTPKCKMDKPERADFFRIFARHLLTDEEYEHLKREEWGSVFLLMLHQWTKQGSLPTDKVKLASLARCSVEELDSLLERWPKLMPIEGKPDRCGIPYLVREYGLVMEFYQEQSNRGKASVAKRRSNHGSTGGSTNQDQDQDEDQDEDQDQEREAQSVGLSSDATAHPVSQQGHLPEPAKPYLQAWNTNCESNRQFLPLTEDEFIPVWKKIKRHAKGYDDHVEKFKAVVSCLHRDPFNWKGTDGRPFVAYPEWVARPETLDRLYEKAKRLLQAQSASPATTTGGKLRQNITGGVDVVAQALSTAKADQSTPKELTPEDPLYD